MRAFSGIVMKAHLDRRHFLQTGLMGAAGLTLGQVPAPAQNTAEGELLYNGIRLPAIWPPRIKDVSAELVVPDYLKSPPAVIPIDVGRQLFVDDFLVAETNLTRSH